MKIVLVNHQDPQNINSFSGISYFMSRALRNTFEDVLEYNDFEDQSTIDDILGGYLGDKLKPIGKRLSDFLRTNEIEADFVLCQGGNSSIPFYDYHIPIVFWHDSTWSSFLKGYESPQKFNEFKTTYKELYFWDKKYMEKAALLIFSSDYVAEACLRNYELPAHKVKVVPFGANLFSPPTSNALNELLQKRLQKEKLNFSFIGKDWERKGLVDAYKLIKRLNLAGVGAQLNIIGCYPDFDDMLASPYVNMVGLIDKFDQEGCEIFEGVLKNTHFLLHPANSEPFGIVLCEANAYGIPVIGTNVEGLKTSIRHGENGFLFEKNIFIDAAFSLVVNLLKEWHKNYTLLFYSAVSEYRQRLNWETNTQKVKTILSNFKKQGN